MRWFSEPAKSCRRRTEGIQEGRWPQPNDFTTFTNLCIRLHYREDPEHSITENVPWRGEDESMMMGTFAFNFQLGMESEKPIYSLFAL